MRSLLTLSCVLFSTLAVAEPIITDGTRLDDLYKKFRENKVYLKLGPIKYEIFNFEIGQPQTPYYERDSQAKRFYRKDNKCFEITIFDTVTMARKVGCFDKNEDLFLEGFEDFKITQINNLIEEGLSSFKVSESTSTYEMLAFVQPYDMFSMDRYVHGTQVEQTAPRKKFKAHLSGSTDVVIGKGVLQLNQVISLKVDKIGILPEKSAQTANTIKIATGGLLFSNGKGEVLIYNPHLPKPFGDYQLIANEQLPQYLAQLEEQSLNAPVCFRDNYVTPGPNDCQKLIFGTHPRGHYKKIKILAIDFIKKTVNFFE